MKNGMMLFLGFSFLFAGCASKLSFVGTWDSIGVPEGSEEQGIYSITLNLIDDGVYTGSYNDEAGTPVLDVKGRWEPVDEGGIAFHLEEGRGPRESTGQLLDDNTLFGTDGSTSLKFSRRP